MGVTAAEEDASSLARPVHDGYFADPFVLRLAGGGYAAYGTNPESTSAEAAFEVLLSDDLATWRSAGLALRRMAPETGDEYWAPEVCVRDGAWWMYYSVGHGIRGHHLRVARAEHPTGPFVDLGVNLTPDESFAIDPHPFQDDDGQWYLYFARDVLDAERAGTHLAVACLPEPARLEGSRSVLEPYADWQIYERDRPMYGGIHDWHTLEGPSVVRRHDRYWMTFSGGAWTGPGYAVSWASSPTPLGPWTPAPASAPALLESGPSLMGPGHNSLVVGPDGRDRIAFHAWNADLTARQMHIAVIDFTPEEPAVELALEETARPIP
ncbi:glycoside hydrolase family 43 protein [Microbacterium sp. 3J1]|uniref:glycoside hydrolase family 43 protein n=1 Tax=Microbacterium sp. 3J1 TaxID=861269 RepID=UPI000A7857F7|nr:glycoside hydrolase family 43 protein [Microbacterium sp. 3J1]